MDETAAKEGINGIELPPSHKSSTMNTRIKKSYICKETYISASSLQASWSAMNLPKQWKKSRTTVKAATYLLILICDALRFFLQVKILVKPVNCCWCIALRLCHGYPPLMYNLKDRYRKKILLELWILLLFLNYMRVIRETLPWAQMFGQ